MTPTRRRGSVYFFLSLELIDQELWEDHAPLGVIGVRQGEEARWPDSLVQRVRRIPLIRRKLTGSDEALSR